MAIYSGFTHKKLWFSIVMLVYQGVRAKNRCILFLRITPYEFVQPLGHESLNFATSPCHGAFIANTAWTYFYLRDADQKETMFKETMLVSKKFIFLYSSIYCPFLFSRVSGFLGNSSGVHWAAAHGVRKPHLWVRGPWDAMRCHGMPWRNSWRTIGKMVGTMDWFICWDL